MSEKIKFVFGFIFVMILLASSIVYVQLNNQVKIRVDSDQTTIYVPHEDYSWIWTVAGRETNKLFDGSSSMYRDVSEITVNTTYSNETNEIWIERITPYKRGPVIKDTYYFNGNIDDERLFPISHTIEIFNASNYFYRYEARDLVYDGPTEKLETTSKSFGKKMEVEWQEDYRWAWVYKTGILKIQYDIPSDYEKYSIRLFDPPVVSYISPTPDNNTNVSQNYLFINVSVSETNPSNITFSISNSTYSNSTIYSMADSSSNTTINFTGLAEDTYTYNVTVVNNESESTTTTTRTVTFDTTNPSLNITFPLNTTYYWNTTYNPNVTKLVINASDTSGLDLCWYSLDSGVINTTFICTTNVTDLQPSNGTNLWTVWVNDTAGNLNETSLTFTLNLEFLEFNVTLNPNITFTFNPDNKSHQQVQPAGQNENYSTFNMTNNLTSEISVYAKVNVTENNITFKMGNSSNYSLAVTIGTEYVKLYHNLTVAANASLWTWADYSTATTRWLPRLTIKGVPI